jgi:hypothetical protein
MPVRQEQSPLDVARPDAVPLGEISNDHQELVPIVEGKAYSVWCPCNGSDFVKELPHADIDHAVPPRIKKREDRRRHRNRDAFEAEQGLESAPLTPCVERALRCSPHLLGVVRAYVSDGSRGLPIADRQKLRSCEMAAAPRGPESVNQGARGLILVRRQMPPNQWFECRVRKLSERHPRPC